MVNVTPAGILPGAASAGSVVHASDAALGNLSRAHDERDISRLQSAITPYNAALTYEINDVVSFSNQAQICIVQITVPEAFDPAKWQVSSSGRGILMISYDTDLAADLEFFAVSGGAPIGQTVETNAQAPMPAPLTIFDIALQVSVNGLGTTTTWVLRVNGADGNGIITVGAGLTGFFEDTVNFDDLIQGDLVCYQYREGGGGGTLTLIGSSCETRNTE
jgi:hypothetical protein